MTTAHTSPLPVTVFTGFLGAGKTSMILSLLKKVPKDYKIVVLKNEFGDVEVDSALVRESNIEVQEMMNGCLCCVLVGQMKNALLELKEKYNPDRVIVETSGSAFPAPIAWQIREMADDGFVLDAILTVIDCINFEGYEDTSYTAKMQAKYTDIILLNKHEQLSEYQLDSVVDRVNELNTDTPRIRVDLEHGLSPSVAFGLDTQLFSLQDNRDVRGENGDSEIDPSIQMLRTHHAREIDIVQLSAPRDTSLSLPSRTAIEAFLGALPADEVYRVKGFVRLDGDSWIVNSAFGRGQLVKARQEHAPAAEHAVLVTVMGIDLRMLVPRLAAGFGLPNSDEHVRAYWRHAH